MGDLCLLELELKNDKIQFEWDRNGCHPNMWWQLFYQKEIDMNFWCKFNKNKYFQNDLFQFLLGDFGDITLN